MKPYCGACGRSEFSSCCGRRPQSFLDGHLRQSVRLNLTEICMTDIVTPEVRSRMMASIKSRDTKPELVVRRYLHGRGFRYALARRGLPGKPDLTLPRHNAVIFVHGCYWHGHQGCRFATTPATRADFWRAKLNANAERDARVILELKKLGWRVAVVWECALRKQPELALRRLEQFLVSGRTRIEIPSSSQPPRNE